MEERIHSPLHCLARLPCRDKSIAAVALANKPASRGPCWRMGGIKGPAMCGRLPTPGKADSPLAGWQDRQDRGGASIYALPAGAANLLPRP